MMRLVEDLLKTEELEAIGRISDSDNPRFDRLVKLSGLEPNQDFKYSDLRWLNMCGADLRGFDFTGSDLRHCAMNANTLIDDTTILAGAAIAWIELEALPIVMKMKEVEAASRSDRRMQLLSELVGEFGKSSHVITYMIAAASSATSLDEFIDFTMFIPPELPKGQAERLRHTAEKLLKKKLSQNKSRTRRDATSIFALDSVVTRLKDNQGMLAARIFSHLADIVNSKNQTVQLGGIAQIERRDIERAFARIGK